MDEEAGVFRDTITLSSRSSIEDASAVEASNRHELLSSGYGVLGNPQFDRVLC